MFDPKESHEVSAICGACGLVTRFWYTGPSKDQVTCTCGRVVEVRFGGQSPAHQAPQPEAGPGDVLDSAGQPDLDRHPVG
jgi:hypothetical protein